MRESDVAVVAPPAPAPGLTMHTPNVLRTLLIAITLLVGCSYLNAEEEAAKAEAAKERVLYYQLSGHVEKGWQLKNADNLKAVEQLAVISSTMFGFKKKLHFDKLVPFETEHLKQKKWHLITFEQGYKDKNAKSSGQTEQVPAEDKNAPGDRAKPAGSSDPDPADKPTKAASTKAASSKKGPGSKASTSTKAANSPKPANSKKAASSSKSPVAKPPANGEKGADEDKPADGQLSVLTIKLEWLDDTGEHHSASVEVENPEESPPSRAPFDSLFKAYVAQAGADDKAAQTPPMTPPPTSSVAKDDEEEDSDDDEDKAEDEDSDEVAEQAAKKKKRKKKKKKKRKSSKSE